MVIGLVSTDEEGRVVVVKVVAKDDGHSHNGRNAVAVMIGIGEGEGGGGKANSSDG